MKHDNSYVTTYHYPFLNPRVLTLLGLSLFMQKTPPMNAQTNTLPPAPSGYSWQANPQLSDEFNGTGLDRTKWNPYHPTWQGRQPSRYEMENVSQTSGALLIHNQTTLTNLSQVTDPTNNLWVGSGCLSSTKPIASYGYYEARIQASRLSMTSGFWLQGLYSEIDVVELMGAAIANPNYGMYMPINTHYFINGWATDKSTPFNWLMPSGAADEFHVYGVWWKDQTNIWFYHNGTNVAKVVSGGKFNEAMYLYFDTEVFTWEGLPTPASLQQEQTNTMFVDWVHAWQLVAN